jgi:hypothetical protein
MRGGFVAYLCAVAGASLLLTWLEIFRSGQMSPGLGVLVWFVSILATFFVAIVMFLPWLLADRIRRWLGWSGPLYFGMMGTVAGFGLGSAAFATVFRPFFDLGDVVPTFSACLAFTMERHGFALAMSGAFGGVLYWLIGERRGISTVDWGL